MPRREHLRLPRLQRETLTMKTYKYTDDTNTVVHVIDADGISRSSMLASALPEGVEVLPADPVVAPIPSVVSMRQARLALLQAGKLDDIEAAVAQLGASAQIEWEYAQTVERSHPLVQSLGMSDTELDALFTQAASL